MSGFVHAFLALIFAFLGGADAPSAVSLQAADDNTGFIHGRVTLQSGEKHEGFLRWEDESGEVISRLGKITVAMDADRTLVAVYGDVTEFYVNDAVGDGGIPAGDDRNPGTSPEYPTAT